MHDAADMPIFHHDGVITDLQEKKFCETAEVSKPCRSDVPFAYKTPLPSCRTEEEAREYTGESFERMVSVKVEHMSFPRRTTHLMVSV